MNSLNTSDDSNVLNALAGKIEVLEMINFMCHSNLELKFNQSINFITGRNGSGKSSIMAALIVVLGGSAAVTGRGSGITDFIKKGETWAKVSITLSNQGKNAFKKELYGSKIVICRSITKNGSNSYSCKSDRGIVISKKKEEVDAIALTFNWQIKNPICILNQDVARSFLSATDNEARFTIFTKATLLENLKTIYAKSIDLLAKTKTDLLIKEKGLKEANQEIIELKDKLALFLALEKHVQGKRNLENEYLWSLVIEEEKQIENLNNNLNDLKEKIRKILEVQKELESTKSKMEMELTEHSKKIKEAKKTDSIKNEEIFSLQKRVQDVEKEIRKTEIQVQQVMKKKEKEETDIKVIKEHLNQCDKDSNKNMKEKERMSEMITSLREKLIDLKEKIAIAEKDFQMTEKNKMHLSRKVEMLSSDMGELEQNEKRLEIMITTGKTKNGENLSKYGHFTQNLLRAIEDAFAKGYFKKKPVGPCGLYVKLSGEQKWARAIESVIGGLMSTYCCDNQKDFQVLTQIMDRVCGGKQPTIIISKFLPNRHNVESKKAFLRDHPCILDVLKFENDVVFNTFIDQTRIETIILFETDKQASSMMTHIQNVPKNLKMGLTLACDQYFPAPNYRTYYGNSTAPLRYFDAALEGANTLKKLEAEAKLVSQTLQKKSSELVQVKNEYSNACESVQRISGIIKQLKHNERKIQIEINQLKDMEESIPVTITKLALEEELSILQKNSEKSFNQLDEYQKSLELFNQRKNELLGKINQIAKEKGLDDESIGVMEEKSEKMKEKYDRMVLQEKDSKKKCAILEENLKNLEKEITRQKMKLEKKLEEAKEICPDRVNTDKPPVEVQKLLEKCERYLKTAEKLTGSKEDTINSYKTKVEAYKKMKIMVEVLEATLDTLSKTATKKLERLKILETHTASLVSFHFQATLQTRGYDGQLKIDFYNKVLDMEVTPKDGTDARKDTKTLSGGERSYSTVSFILAIWKVVNMPVYFLDEFDVFMDKINRKVIMDLLLEHATVNNNKQFVFITPQDIPNIPSLTPITVYKLPDPKRKTTN